MVKNPPANGGDISDVGSVSGSGRPPGGGHGNTLQYFCLENPTDRGAWWATIYWVTKSHTRLKRRSTHSQAAAAAAAAQHGRVPSICLKTVKALEERVVSRSVGETSLARS